MGLRRLLVAMPRCVSQYEDEHPICDGDGAMRPPCAHRDLCVAMRCVMIERSVPREAMVVLVEDEHGKPYAKPKDPKKLENRLGVAIGRYGVAQGQTKVTPVPRHAAAAPATPGAKPVARRGTKAPPRPGNAILLDMWYREWVQIIADMTKRDVARIWAEADHGDIFAVDRRRTSGYVGLYISAKGDWPGIGIGCLVWRSRMVRMDVKFPLPPGGFDGIGVEAMRWLKPQAASKGRWRSVSRGLDRAGVRLSAEVIAQLLNRGKIKVPEP